MGRGDRRHSLKSMRRKSQRKLKERIRKAATERAAHEDPMKCERDPKCDKKRGRTQDCSMQCSDDPACVERCEQVQSTTKLGH